MPDSQHGVPTRKQLEQRAKDVVRQWAWAHIKDGYRIEPYLQWNSNSEVYLGGGIWKGQKRLGQVMVMVPTPAYISEYVGGEVNPSTDEVNMEWVYRWLASDGDMGYDPFERLTEDAEEGNEFPKEALRGG